MAVIGGFRSDLSITRKTDGNWETFPQVFCFPKSRINENGGKTTNPIKIDLMFSQDMWKLNFMLDFSTFRISKGNFPFKYVQSLLKTPLSIESKVRCRVYAVCG